MAFKIADPVDDVPVIRTNRGPIWDAVIAGNGKWVPVEMETKEQANKLVSNAKARNDHVDIHRGRYEARQRGTTVYIRFLKNENVEAA